MLAAAAGRNTTMKVVIDVVPHAVRLAVSLVPLLIYLLLGYVERRSERIAREGLLDTKRGE